MLEQNIIYALAHSGALLAVPPTAFSSIQASYLPLVILAITIDALIAALWYMAGSILANNTVKAGAKAEFYQVVATALIAGIVIGTLLLFGNLYWQSVTGTNHTVLTPSTVSAMCSSIAQQSASTSSFGLPGSLVGTEFLSNPSSPMNNPSVCDIVNAAAAGSLGTDSTELIDYPLAAAATVTANLATQAGSSLNDIFVLDSYLSFLSKFTITLGVCLGADPAEGCAGAPVFGVPPIPGAPAPSFYLKFYGTPLAGINIITRALTTTSSLLYYAIGSFVAQLLFDNIFIFMWPWLLFAGLVLRGVFFLRRIGGLLIAIAIGAILIYPTMFSIEYLASNNTAINGNVNGYGFLDQNLIFCGNAGYRYGLDFFNLPSISGIASDCGCWPWAGLTGSEFLVWIDTNTPGIYLGALWHLISNWITGNAPPLSDWWQTLLSVAPQNPQGFINDVGAFGVPVCGFGAAQGTYPAVNAANYVSAKSRSGGGYTIFSPVQYYSDGEGMVFGITQAYGILGISAYFLPIMNIIITIAGIIGLSGILGGDVELAGLSRLV